MASVISSDGLGLYNATVARSNTPNPQADQVFINTATGNLVVQRQDEYSAALGLDLGVVRTYNAQGQFSDDNGDNWLLNVHQRVYGLTGTVNTAGSTITKVYGDGYEALFAFDTAQGLYISTAGAGAHDSLSFNTTTQTWTFSDGRPNVQERFDSTGRLIETRDDDGHIRTYTYTGALLTQISDASGQSTFFDYTGTKLTQIRTVSGTQEQTVVRYAYDTLNRLSQVTVDLSPEDNTILDGKVYTTAYTYDGTSTRIASITHGDGTTVSFTYTQVNGEWRVGSVTDGSGAVTQYTYPATGVETLSVSANPAALATTDTVTTTTDFGLNSTVLSTTDTVTETVVVPPYYLVQAGDTWASIATTLYGTADVAAQLQTVQGNPALTGGAHLTDLPASLSVTTTTTVTVAPYYTIQAADTWASVAMLLYGTSAVADELQIALGNPLLTAGARLTNLPVFLTDTVTTTTDYALNTAAASTTDTITTTDTFGLNAAALLTTETQTTTTQATLALSTLTPAPLPPPLTQTLTNLSAKKNESVFFTFEVPQGAGDLHFNIFGGSGDADLYVRFGAPPTLSTYDFRPFMDGNDEAVVVNAPQPGTWHVMLNGFRAFSGVTLSQRYQYGPPDLVVQSGQPKAGLSAVQGDFLMYQIDVPTGAGALDISIGGGTGDADLYVRFGAPPTTSTYDFRPFLNGNNESVSVSAPQAGTWYLMIRGFAAFSGVTLNAAYTLANGNTLPQVNVGSDQLVVAGNTIALTGIASDSNGSIANFTWTQILGPAVVLSEANTASANFTAPTVTQPTLLRFALTVTDDLGATNRDTVDVWVSNDAGYVIQTGDTWNSIATTLYGTTEVADQLQTALGSPALTPGNRLTNLPATLTATTTTTVTVPPYYLIQTGDTWASIATTLYGTAEVAGQLQTAVGNPALTAGQRLTDLPTSLSVTTTSTVTVAPYYTIQATDTWASIATALYGTPDVADELQTALGNPLLTVGTRLTNLPASLTDTVIATTDYALNPAPLSTTDTVTTTTNFGINSAVLLTTDTVTTTITVPAYYTIQTGDTWASIATTLYGTADVAGDLQTALGNPLLSAGDRLTNLPATLSVTTTETITVPPYYTVQAGDTWASIALSIYADARAADALETALGSPALTAGTRLTGLPQTLSFTVTVNTPRQTDVVNALGQRTSYFTDPQGQLIGLTDALGQQMSYTYDGDGNVTSTTDAKGNTLSFTYDAQGNRLSQQDSLGNTVAYTYSASNRLLTETVYLIPDPDGAGALQASAPTTSRFVYDAEEHLRFVVSPEGRVTEHRYDAPGNRISTIAYTQGVYNLTGLTPADAVTEAQLQSWTGLQDQTKAQRIDYAYDFRGQLSTTTTYASVDALGNGISDGTHATTRYVYDQKGRLLESIDPRGETTPTDTTDYRTAYTYDGLGRLLTTTQWVSASETRTTFTDYDDANNRVLTTLRNGLVTTSVFDARGLLISRVAGNGTTALGTTTFHYDAAGRLRFSTDPVGITSHRLYDEAGRIIAQIDATGALSENVYDAADNLIQSIDYATRLDATQLASLVDLNGNPAEVSLDSIRPVPNVEDRTTRYIFDQAERLVLTIDPEGYVTQSFYDGAGRITDVIGYANTIDLALLASNPTPADAELLITASPQDRHTRSFFDQDGRLLATLDAEGYLSEQRYDGAGQLIETIGYATATTASLRTSGTLAQLRPLASAEDQHTDLFYNARGQLTATLDPENYLTESRYDVAGNEIERVRYATKANTYTGVETLTQLRPLPAANDRVTLTSYNGANQITSITTNPSGTTTTYEYDAVGNLVSTINAANTAEARTTRARYDLQGRIVGALTGAGSATLEQLLATNPSATQSEIDALWVQYGLSHSYDAAGRRTATTDANGNKTLFFYNPRGNLRFEINALGEVSETQYDAFQQRRGLIRYANRLSATQLGTLSGGTVTQALRDAVTGLASAQDRNRRINYTLRGAVNQALDAEGFSTTYTYNAFGERIGQSQQISTTQSLEHSYAFDKRGLLTQTVWDSVAGGIKQTETRTYDAFGRVINQSDANGHVSTFAYDKLGRVIETRDPLLHLRTTTYDAFDRVFTQTDALGHTTTYSYDDASRAVTVTTPEGIATSAIRNRHGETVSITDGNGNATTYAYDKNGNLVSTTDALGKVTRSEFDRADRLIKSIDAQGTATVFSYEAAGRVATRTLDPAGLNIITQYRYNSTGQVIETIDARGVSTVTQYDKKGQALSVIVDPQSTTNPSGLNLTTTYTYDGRGKTLTVVEGAGTSEAQTTQYIYDTLGRRTREIKDPGGLNITTAYTYDLNNNVVAKTEGVGTPDARTTRYVYDASDQLTYSVDASGAVVRSTYDDEGRITAATEYANAIALTGLGSALTEAEIIARLTPDLLQDQVTQYAYDRDGRILETVYAAGTVDQYSESYAYDGTGNRIRHIDGRGFNTYFAFDGVNRIIRSIDALGYVTEFGYDNVGNRIQEVISMNAVALPAAPDDRYAYNAPAPTPNIEPVSGDRITIYGYDAANRLIRQTDALGVITAYAYDAIGQLIDTVEAQGLPEERTTHRVYASAGRIIEKTTAFGTAEAATSRYSYDALGNQIGILDPRGVELSETDSDWAQSERLRLGYTVTDLNGPRAKIASELTAEEQDQLQALYATTQVFDIVGRKTAAIDPLGGKTETLYNGLGDIVKTTDPNGNAGYFYYDALGRVTLQVDPEGYATQTVFDAAGNAVETIKYANTVQGAYTETTAIEILTSLPLTPPQAYLVRDSQKDQRTLAHYDALNRTTQITDAEGFTESFTYDAQGNVIQHTDKNQNVFTYDYDALNRKIAEHFPITSLNNLGVSTPVVNRFEYDAVGNKTKSIEAQGLPEERLTQYVYDKADRLTETIHPAIQSPTYVTPTNVGTLTIVPTTSPDVPVLILFGNQPPEATSLRLWVWPEGQPDNIKTFDLPQTAPGTFTGSNDVLQLTGGPYEYEAIATNAQNELLNHLQGTFTLNNGVSAWELPTVVDTVATAALVGEFNFSMHSTHVAADERGNVIAAWHGDQGLVVNHYVAGQGWQTPTVIRLTFSSHWNLLANAHGDAILVWEEFRTVGTQILYDLWTSRYVAGQGWQVPRVVASNHVSMSGRAAIDEAGNAMFVWLQGTTAYSQRYDFASNTWEAPQIIVASGSAHVRLAMDGQGNAMAMWVQSDGLWVNRYDVGTRSWSGSPTRLATSVTTDFENVSSGLEIKMNSRGDAVAAWRASDGIRVNLWVNRYIAGQGWQVAELVENHAVTVYFSRHITDASPIAIADNGDVVIAWQIIIGMNEYREIYLNRYVAGAGWEGVRYVGRTHDTFGSNGGVPHIVMDALGNTVVMWSEDAGTYQTVIGLSNKFDVTALRYDAESGAWQPREWVETFSETAMKPSVTLDTHGNAYAIWSLREGSYDRTYVSRFQAGSRADVPAPAITSQLQFAPATVVTTGTPVVNTVTRAQTLNAFGEVMQEIDGRENVTNFAYNKRGQLIEKLDPDTNTTLANGAVVQVRPAMRYFYDINGRTVGQEDPNGNRNTQRFDNAGHLIAEHDPYGGVKSYGYDVFGNTRFTDNELGFRTSYTYDAKNQLIRLDRPTDNTFGTDALGNPLARIEEYRYDEAGQRIGERDTSGNWEYTYYDDIGRVIRTVSAAGRAIGYRYIYDAVSGGTIQITSFADGRSLEDTSDYFGRQRYHKDLGNRTFRYYYNEAGWLTHQIGSTDPQSASTAYLDLRTAPYDPRSYADGAAFRAAQPGIDQYIEFDYYANGYLREVADYGVNRRVNYEYDANGNRIFEGYRQLNSIGAPVYYQWSRAEYDELNRVSAVHDPKFDVSYEYDVAGNRRHVFARYHDGLQGDVQIQDYWYDYDKMNRFTVTKGSLQGARGAGTIVAGSEGYAISYDLASQRRTANNERYDYNAGGLLTTTHIDNALRAQRVYDIGGNVKQYLEFDTTGTTITRNYQYTYTADHQVKTENNASFTSTYSYDATGNLLRVFSPQTGANITTSYRYSFWDTAKQAEIRIEGQTTNFVSTWAPGFSRFSYDVNGHLTAVSDVVADRHLTYQLDHDGRILQREEILGTQANRSQSYYYLNGVGIGDAGGFGTSRNDYATLLASRGQSQGKTAQAVSSADFDYSYLPINDTYPATTPGSYTVRQGDTLQTVALAVWGDSSLWYLIADANGLSGTATLSAGQILVIPNVVANIHNNASTIRVYNSGEIIGDTTPTLPDPPPPPPPLNKDKGKCGGFGQILVIVVQAVVTAWLGPIAGNIAGQLTAMAAGLQEQFSWKSVAAAAVTGKLIKGLDLDIANATTPFQEFAYGAAQNAVSQGVSMTFGLQEKFSWRSVASAGIAAPINQAIGNDFRDGGPRNSTSLNGASWTGFGRDFAQGLIQSAVTESVKSLVMKDYKPQWGAVAAESLGAAIGYAIDADVDRTGRRQRALEAFYKQNGIPYTRDVTGTPVPAMPNTGGSGGGGPLGGLLLVSMMGAAFGRTRSDNAEGSYPTDSFEDSTQVESSINRNSDGITDIGRSNIDPDEVANRIRRMDSLMRATDYVEFFVGPVVGERISTEQIEVLRRTGYLAEGFDPLSTSANVLDAAHTWENIRTGKIPGIGYVSAALDLATAGVEFSNDNAWGGYKTLVEGASEQTYSFLAVGVAVGFLGSTPVGWGVGAAAALGGGPFIRAGAGALYKEYNPTDVLSKIDWEQRDYELTTALLTADIRDSLDGRISYPHRFGENGVRTVTVGDLRVYAQEKETPTARYLRNLFEQPR